MTALQVPSSQPHFTGNPQHLSLLGSVLCKEGVMGFNQWRAQNLSLRLSLSGINLSRLDLTGIDLSNCDLQNALFFETKLGDANFSLTDCSRACFRNVFAPKLNAYSVRWHQASFSDSHFNQANFCDSWLCETLWSHTSLIGAHLRKTQLRQCDMDHVNFNGALLTESQWLASELIHVQFLRANMFLANFRSSQFDHCDFSYAQAKGADFCESRWQENQASYLNAQGAAFFQASLHKCHLEKSDFQSASLGFWMLQDCNLTATTFKNANLTDTRAKDCDFHRCDMSETNFNFSRWENCNFSKAELSGSKLYGLGIEGSKLDQAYCSHIFTDAEGRLRVPKLGRFKDGEFKEFLAKNYFEVEIFQTKTLHKQHIQTPNPQGPVS